MFENSKRIKIATLPSSRWHELFKLIRWHPAWINSCRHWRSKAKCSHLIAEHCATFIRSVWLHLLWEWHSMRWKCFQMFTNWDVWERDSDSLIRRDVWMRKEEEREREEKKKCLAQRTVLAGTIIISFSAFPNPWKRFYKYMMGVTGEEEVEGGVKEEEIQHLLNLKSQKLKMSAAHDGVRIAMHGNKFMFIVTAAICISYLLIMDWKCVAPGDPGHCCCRRRGCCCCCWKPQPTQESQTFHFTRRFTPSHFQESIRAGPGTVPCVKGISRSLAQLHSAPPVLAALHAETGLFYTQAIWGRYNRW